MKKIKRFAAVLLAGIMALALLTACGGSGSDNPEFDAEVESAYLDPHRREKRRGQPDRQCTLQNKR